MTFFFEILDFLTVVLTGLVLLGQAFMIGGIAFVACLLRPFAAELGQPGAVVMERSRIFIGLSAIGLVFVQGLMLMTKISLLEASAGITTLEAASASFAVAGFIAIAATLAIALLSRGSFDRTLPWLIAFAAVTLGASTGGSHAAARIDDRGILIGAMLLHQIGADVWIGGIPYFLIALRRAPGPEATRIIGRRFSHMAMVSVGLLLVGAIILSFDYLDSIGAIYSTSYGAMVATKVLMLAALLFFGWKNSRTVERLRRDPATPLIRLRRFAEAEVGIGVTVFLVAASLTSLPPARDLPFNRMTLKEVADGLLPHWPPRLTSPEQKATSNLSMTAQQERYLAATRMANLRSINQDVAPIPTRSAQDIAWSEFNHNWAGIIVLAIGLFALAERAGLRWGRHWPLLFIVLATFLFFRNDPANWPVGPNGFFESFADPGAAQHRAFIVLITLFAIFEWGIRTGRIKSPRAALVFPLSTAVASALMLTHSHSLENIKQELLVEMTHVPLALCGVAASWARWLEIRLPPSDRSIPAWIWPVCFVLIGFILIFYREA